MAPTTQPIEKIYEDYATTYRAKYGPRTAVLMAVGKFYSLYDAVHTQTGQSRLNVPEIAEICAGVPSNGGGGGGGNNNDTASTNSDPEWTRILWGFPELALPKYERILVSAGYTVVVIGQDRDPTGEVRGRSLSYISSPGTYIDTESAAERCVVGLLIEAFEDRQGRNQWCIASTAFDVATGASTSLESVVPILDGKPDLDTLHSFWAVHPPSETIVWVRGTLSISEQQVRTWLQTQRGPVHILAAPTTSAATTRGSLEFLHRVFNVQTALSVPVYLGVECYPAALECLTYLLRFIEDHNPSFLSRLSAHTMWEPAHELVLGNAALQQLAVLPPSSNPTECLLHWLQGAITAVGKRALRERCVKPISDVAELNARQDRIEELRNGFVATDILTRTMWGIQDLPRLFRVFELGKGTAAALVRLLTSYQKCRCLADALSGTLSAAPAEAISHIDATLSAWSLDRIDVAHEHGLGRQHPWIPGLHSALDAAEAEWAAVDRDVRALKATWDDLLGESDAIKLEWRPEETAFVITATKRRAAALATVLKTRRKTTLDVQTRGASSTATLGCEEITALNERAAQIWSTWEPAVAATWRATWATWQGCWALVDWLGRVDTEFAFARCAEKYRYVRPTYIGGTEEAGISCRELRHPILERVHTETPYIPHSIALGALDREHGEAQAQAESGILLYGVNAAGKSSLSKAIGLAVLMAQIGMPVAATEMHIAPYNSLFTRILGNDNLWAGMSSFVVEMTEFRAILKAAGPRTLVLGDELCAGTETVSALAIVAAGIQTLAERRSQFVFATHLHELTEIPEVRDCPAVRAYHLSVQAGPAGRLIYDRQLREGAGSPIYGLEVCRGLDMDAAFLEKATALRRRLDASADLGKTSRYNAAVPVQACHVCGSREGLETHHIVQQSAADVATGLISAHRHKNDASNLVVLCADCHDKHHAGEIEVRGWKATSAGRVLDLSKYRYTPNKTVKSQYGSRI